jgi:molybdopterin/thiamine biosynthesis adenylyltransferase
VFTHTHPFGLNDFSSVDDEGERALAEFLQMRIPESRHAALLVTPETTIARELGCSIDLRVVGVGPTIAWSGTEALVDLHDRYDRQVRAFGRLGQRLLESLRVGIVGLGGTGSVVLQQLVHLGVSDFLLIDPDTIETSNLNRLVGATPKNVGMSKVGVAASWARQINPEVRIESCEDSVLRTSVAKLLANTDFVFCCTDSHGSRAVLNQLAYQYLVPMIDMGVRIATERNQITHITGRTQMLAPGLACLTCANLLDPEEVRRDMLTDFERQADPYILGQQEPAPSIISLNTTVASLSVTMFIDSVLGIPGNARFIIYDAITGTTRPAFCTPHPSCIVCSVRGALARGDEWPLPARIG